MKEVEKNIEEAQHLFLQVSEEAVRDPDASLRRRWREYSDSPFYAIALEAASFEVAANDLAANGNLGTWKTFLHVQDEIHLKHLLIGAGLAIAKNEKPFIEFESEFSTEELRSVIDGTAYYNAWLRSGITLVDHKIPDTIPKDLIFDFNSGIGRRFWFECNGNSENVAEKITLFPAERRAGIWHGVGVTSTYIGGLHYTEFSNLLDLSGEFSHAFREGAMQSLQYRKHEGKGNHDAELACIEIFNCLLRELEVRQKGLPLELR